MQKRKTRHPVTGAPSPPIKRKCTHIPTQNSFLLNRAKGAGNSLIETLYYLDKTELDYLFVY